MVFPHVDHTCCHEKNIREGKFNYLITQCVYSSCFLEQQKEKKIGWQIQKCCTRQKAIPRTERLYSLIDPRLNSLAVFLSLLGLVEIHACNKWNKITYGHMITQRRGCKHAFAPKKKDWRFYQFLEYYSCVKADSDFFLLVCWTLTNQKAGISNQRVEQLLLVLFYF